MTATAENIVKVEGLIKRFLAAVENPQAEKAAAVVFGSSAAALWGVDLGRPVKDLDLFVSDADYDRIEKITTWGIEKIEKAPGVYGLEIAAWSTEFLKEFPGVDYHSVRALATPVTFSHGMLVASLGDLLAWKNEQIRGNPRDKDFKDRDAIMAAMKANA